MRPRGSAFRARAEVGRLVHDRNRDATAGSGVNDAGLPDEVAAALGPPAALERDGVEAAGAEAPALARLDVLHEPEHVTRLTGREEAAVRERTEELHGLAGTPLRLPESRYRAHGRRSSRDRGFAA